MIIEFVGLVIDVWSGLIGGQSDDFPISHDIFICLIYSQSVSDDFKNHKSTHSMKL